MLLRRYYVREGQRVSDGVEDINMATQSNRLLRNTNADNSTLTQLKRNTRPGRVARGLCYVDGGCYSVWLTSPCDAIRLMRVRIRSNSVAACRSRFLCMLKICLGQKIFSRSHCVSEGISTSPLGQCSVDIWSMCVAVGCCRMVADRHWRSLSQPSEMGVLGSHEKVCCGIQCKCDYNI